MWEGWCRRAVARRAIINSGGTLERLRSSAKKEKGQQGEPKNTESFRPRCVLPLVDGRVFLATQSAKKGRKTARAETTESFRENPAVTELSLGRHGPLSSLVALDRVVWERKLRTYSTNLAGHKDESGSSLQLLCCSQHYGPMAHRKVHARPRVPLGEK